MEVVETISITSLVRRGMLHLYLPFIEFLQIYIQVQRRLRV